MTSAAETYPSPAPNALEPALNACERAFLLHDTRCGEDDVRQLCSDRREQLMHDDAFGTLKCLTCLGGVRMGLQNVLADDVQSLDFTGRRARDNLSRGQAAVAGH